MTHKSPCPVVAVLYGAAAFVIPFPHAESLAADPIEVPSWNVSASIFSSMWPITPGSDSKSGTTFESANTAADVVINQNGYTGHATAQVLASGPNLVQMSDTPNPVLLQQFHFHETVISDNLNCSTDGQATIVLNQPAMAIFEEFVYYGRHFNLSPTMTGPAGFDWHDYWGNTGKHSYVQFYKPLAAGTYTLDFEGGGIATGSTNRGGGDADLYFIVPEPAASAAVLLALPALAFRRRR
jgi:hypothetical protein